MINKTASSRFFICKIAVNRLIDGLFSFTIVYKYDFFSGKNAVKRFKIRIDKPLYI